jgi:hypothetical protein
MRRQRAVAVALDLLLAATNAPATGRVSQGLPFDDGSGRKALDSLSGAFSVRRGAKTSGLCGEAVKTT